MPPVDPASRPITFPAIYNGVSVLVTAVAYSDQVDIVFAPGHRLEIELHVWQQLATRATVAAHTRPSPPG